MKVNLIDIRRETDATRINSILNNPDIRPWIADESEGVIDVTFQLDNRRNILLMGEHGGILFLHVLPGIYEAHTQVLPEARGEWTTSLTNSALYWMFTRTDCYEVLTRVPKGHLAARSAAINAGMKHEFERKDGCKFRGKILPVNIYGLRIQDWVLQSPFLVEKGEWFHKRLHEEALKIGITEPPHENDENHNRFAAASFEMANNGEILKALSFYNRWAIVSRHDPVYLLENSPPVFKMDIGLLKIQNNDIELFHEV